MSRKTDIIRVLADKMVLWPHNKINEATLIAYAEELEEYAPANVKTALKKLARESEFFPTLAAIHKELQAQEDLAAGRALPTAAEAWEQVMKNARWVGVYTSKPWQFSAPEIEQAVRQFGGRDCFCMLSIDEMQTARAQFRRIYEGIVASRSEGRNRDYAMRAITGGRLEQLAADIANKRGIQ